MNETVWWYLTSNSMTIAVAVCDGVVVQAPPIARHFVGQPSKNLGNWMRMQGGFAAEPLAVEAEG